MKSAYLERQFKTYIDGAELPAVDLSAAKREVIRSKSQRRGKRIAAILSSVLSAAAVVVLAVTLAIGLMPSYTPPETYLIADAAPMSATYTSLSEKYPEKTAPFASFFFASNASSEYALISLGGEEVLMEIELSSVGGGRQMRARVYIDLTDGEKQPQELEAYKELAAGGAVRSETKYENGEYVSRAYCTLADGSDCYIDMTSNDDSSLSALLDLIRK